MTTSQFWIYMFTVMLSPLIAIQVSEFLRKRSDVRARQLWVFRTLMATRAAGLSPEHVQALNMIPIEFDAKGRKSRDVAQAYKAYLDHLATKGGSEAWGDRQQDLFFALLHKMSIVLGYDLDMTDMRRTSYAPVAHGEMEMDQVRIRKALLAILEGKSSLPVSPFQTSAAATTAQPATFTKMPERKKE